MLPYSRISKNTGPFQGISVPDRRRSGKAHGLHKVIGLLQELYQDFRLHPLQKWQEFGILLKGPANAASLSDCPGHKNTHPLSWSACCRGRRFPLCYGLLLIPGEAVVVLTLAAGAALAVLAAGAAGILRAVTRGDDRAVAERHFELLLCILAVTAISLDGQRDFGAGCIVAQLILQILHVADGPSEGLHRQRRSRP